MRDRFTPGQIETVQDSIFYLKMCELRDLARSMGLPSHGQKRELITSIMRHIRGLDTQTKISANRARSKRQEYKLDAQIRPDSYTNGSAARSFLKRKIGPHFRFTTYGMDWIKEQWASGLAPTFQEFIEFWEEEYRQRQCGKPFLSKPELARVNFYRRMAELGNHKRVELEALWKEIRLRHVETVRSVLTDWM